MKIISRAKSKSKNIFYGWRVVAAGSFLYGQGIGTIMYGFSAFFNPLMNEFGWTRASISGIFSLSRFEGGIEGLIVGPIIDRFGVRKVAFIGITITGLGFFVMLCVTQNIVSLYLIFGILISMGFNAGFSRPADTAAAKWFIKKRSRALAIVTAGGGIGGAVMAPLMAWLIINFGWRSASVVTGLMFLGLGLPAAYFLRSTPEEMGLQPDGEEAAEDAEATTDDSAGEINFTVKEALKTSAFWIYTVGMFFRMAVLNTIIIHQIPYLVDMGIEYQAAAAILGYTVLVSFFGRLGFGFLGDIVDKRLVIFGTCLLQTIGIFIFINASSLWILYVYVVVYGLGYGGALPLSHALRADLFGRKTFATMMGITGVLGMLPTVLVPVLIGHLYDATQSYTIGFYTLMIANLIGGFAFLLVKQPKPPARLTGKGGHDANSSRLA